VVGGRPTIERRSPLALAHDPPVERFDWTIETALHGEEVLTETVRRAGWSSDDAERLARHAGLHLDGHRLLPERPPRLVAAGTRVVAYRLSAEPRLPDLPDEALLLDRAGLVAVAKPPWLTVQGTRASRLGSLERLLRERLDRPRLTPVHRLDRETSGVVLFAGDAEAASDLGRQFQRRTVEKRYLAVIAPPPERDEWTVEGLLVRAAHPAHSLFALSEDAPAGEGKPSRTRFHVLERAGARGLVEAWPETGRTHQLRVHLAASGCPIVGDSRYGTGWLPGAPGSGERLQLHAERLRFRRSGEPFEVAAPPPGDFGLGA
jgi:RluA family pseudouridine synthase